MSQTLQEYSKEKSLILAEFLNTDNPEEITDLEAYIVNGVNLLQKDTRAQEDDLLPYCLSEATFSATFLNYKTNIVKVKMQREIINGIVVSNRLSTLVSDTLSEAFKQKLQ